MVEILVYRAGRSVVIWGVLGDTVAVVLEAPLNCTLPPSTLLYIDYTNSTQKPTFYDEINVFLLKRILIISYSS